MSSQIPTHFVQAFADNLTLLSQQKGSKLRGCVVEDNKQAKTSHHDQIGAVEAVDITTRHADTPVIDTPHARRSVTMIPSDWGDLIDDTDRLQTLNDPTSTYSINATHALGRGIDRRICGAFFADAWTGETGTTKVTFPAGNAIAVNYVASGVAANSGLTVPKLRRARTLLLNGDIDDDEEFYIAVTAQQIDDLLATTEATSADYNNVKALVDGQIEKFMGFTFKRVSARILPKTGSNRLVPVWAKSGMLLNVAKNPTVQIATRADKRFATQVYASQMSGATRLEEAKVMQIQCLEA